MRNLIFTVLLVGFVFNSSSAQDLRQLVRVHLNNRMYFTGIIVEKKVTTDHLVMVTWGGDILKLGYDSIAKYEPVRGRPSEAAQELINEKYLPPRPPKPAATFQNHGYFALIQYCTGYLHWGVSSVHGYKFNQFLHVGVGAGFDGVGRPITLRPKRFKEKYENATGLYIPLFVYLGGDIVQKRTTPYYGLEIGYAYGTPNKNLLDLETREISPHSIHATTSFGLKFNSSKRYHTNVGLKLTYRAREMKFREVIYDEESNLYHLEFNKVMTSSWFFGLTVVQGF